MVNIWREILYRNRKHFAAYTPWQNVMNAPWLQTLINTANTNTKK